MNGASVLVCFCERNAQELQLSVPVSEQTSRLELISCSPEAALRFPDFQEGCSLFFDDFVAIFSLLFLVLLFLEDSNFFQVFLCVFVGLIFYSSQH